MTIYWKESDTYVGWISDVVTPTTTIDTLNPCLIVSSEFSFEKFTPTSDLPTGTWYGTGMFNTIAMNAESGVCPIFINATVTKNPCKSDDINVGELQVEVYGGNGGPYSIGYITVGLPTIKGTANGVFLSSFTINGSNLGGFNTIIVTASDGQGGSSNVSINITFDDPSILNYDFYPEGLLNGFATTWAENYVEYGGRWDQVQTTNTAENDQRSVTLYSTVYMDLTDDTLPLDTPISDFILYGAAIKPGYKVKLQPGRNDYARVQDLFEYYSLFSEAQFYWPGGGSVAAGWYSYDFNRSDVYEPFISWGGQSTSGNRIFESWTVNTPPTPNVLSIQVRSSNQGSPIIAQGANAAQYINKGEWNDFNDKNYPGVIAGAQGGSDYYTYENLFTNPNEYFVYPAASDFRNQISSFGYTYGTDPNYNGNILTFGGNPSNSIFQNQPGSYEPTTGYYGPGYPRAAVGFMRLIGWYDSINGCNTNVLRPYTPNGFKTISTAQVVFNGGASFIPGEKRGLSWVSVFISVGELLPIKKGVKFAFRHKTYLKSKDGSYTPTNLLEFTNSSLNNTCYITPITIPNTNFTSTQGNLPLANLNASLNGFNSNNITVGGKLRLEIYYYMMGVGSPIIGANRTPRIITTTAFNTQSNNLSGSQNLNPHGIDELTTACATNSNTYYTLGTATQGATSQNAIQEHYREQDPNTPSASITIEIDVNKTYTNLVTGPVDRGVSSEDVLTNWTSVSPLINIPRPYIGDYETYMNTSTPNTSWTNTIPWSYTGWPS